jgi:hypothetical protein
VLTNDVLFLLQAGISTLSALKAMGCPDALFCVDTAVSGAMDQGEGVNGKQGRSAGAGASRKAVHQQLEDLAALPDARCVDIDSSSSSGGHGNSNVLARTLRSWVPKPVVWRAQRSYLLADTASVKVQQVPGASTCTVQLQGYLRGKPMHLHSLMHVVGAGAARVVKVWQGQPPGARVAVDLSAQAVQADKSRYGNRHSAGVNRQPQLMQRLSTGKSLCSWRRQGTA